MSNQFILPIEQIISPSTGKPVFNARLFFGRQDSTDLATNPASRVPVFFVDGSGAEIPLAQPVRTNAAGNPVNAQGGSPVQIRIKINPADSGYSFLAQTDGGAQVLYQARVNEGFVSTDALAAVDSGVLVGGVTAEKIGSRASQWVSVTDPEFGADKTGATFSSDAFIAAQAASDYIIVPAGNYSMDPSKTIIVQSNKTWFFMGPKLYISGNGQIFNLDNKSGFRLLGAATLFGSATLTDINGPVPVSSEIGIYQNACSDFIVENITCRQFKGAGIFLTGSLPPIVNPKGGYTFAERGRWSNIGLYANVKGLVAEAGNGGEYQSFVNVDASNNNIALSVAAGNISMVGGNSSGNRVNLYLFGGTNNGHGRISGLSLNHGLPFNLLCEDVTLGMTLTGCHFYANDDEGSGRIEILNSKGISIEGGQIDCRVIVNESGPNSGLNYITGAYTPATYGGVQIRNQAGERPKTLIVSGCTGYGLKNPLIGNSNINDPAPMYISVSRAPLTKQNITASTLTTLAFPTVEVNGDNRGVYNAAAGVATIPADFAGNYNIKAQVVVEGSTLTPAQSWLGLYVGGAQDTIVYPTLVSSVDTNPTFIFDLDVDLYLSSGIVELRLFAVGTNIKFGALCKSRLTISIL